MLEATLSRSELNLNNILDNIPECVLFMDIKGIILSFNNKAKEDFLEILIRNWI